MLSSHPSEASGPARSPSRASTASRSSRASSCSPACQDRCGSEVAARRHPVAAPAGQPGQAGRVPASLEVHVAEHVRAGNRVASDVERVLRQRLGPVEVAGLLGQEAQRREHQRVVAVDLPGLLPHAADHVHVVGPEPEPDRERVVEPRQQVARVRREVGAPRLRPGERVRHGRPDPGDERALPLGGTGHQLVGQRQLGLGVGVGAAGGRFPAEQRVPEREAGVGLDQGPDGRLDA